MYRMFAELNEQKESELEKESKLMNPLHKNKIYRIKKGFVTIQRHIVKQKGDCYKDPLTALKGYYVHQTLHENIGWNKQHTDNFDGQYWS